jgi:hypothetical protein
MSFQAKERLELVHGDLCGPVTPVTPRRSFNAFMEELAVKFTGKTKTKGDGQTVTD